LDKPEIDQVTPIDSWQPDYADSAPIFADLRRIVGRRTWSDWPNCDTLNALLANRVVTLSGIRVRFSPQDHTLPLPGIPYEERVYRTGVISTRERNWHDLFNALMWLLWPELKSSMNAAHVREMSSLRGANRSRLRDAMTLLDESGVIVAASDRADLEALRDHHWKAVFRRGRARWNHVVRAFIVGHALYEKALAPYPGLTGRTLLLQVDQGFFSLDLHSQFKILDRHAASLIATTGLLKTPHDLGVLPLLGIPGWHFARQDAAFYDNPRVFRPRKRPDRSPGPIVTHCPQDG